MSVLQTVFLLYFVHQLNWRLQLRKKKKRVWVLCFSIAKFPWSSETKFKWNPAHRATLIQTSKPANGTHLLTCSSKIRLPLPSPPPPPPSLLHFPPAAKESGVRSLGLNNVQTYVNLCNVRVVERSTPQRRNIVRIFHPIFVVCLVKMAEDGKVSKVLKYILFTFNLLYWVSCEILLQMCCIRHQRDFPSTSVEVKLNYSFNHCLSGLL